MSERPTPETDNNDYAHAFLEQYGYESSLQDAPVDWADFARRLERERDAERALADRLADALVATLRGNLAKMEIPIHLTRLRQRFRTILMEGGPQ